MSSMGIHFKKVEILENLNVALSKSGLLYVDGLSFFDKYIVGEVQLNTLIANYFSSNDLQVYNSMVKHNLVDFVIVEQTYIKVINYNNLVDLFLILEFLFWCKYDDFGLFSSKSFMNDFEEICQLKRNVLQSLESIQDIYNEIRTDIKFVNREKYATYMLFVDKFQSQALDIQKDIDFKMNLLKLKRYLNSQVCISTYCN